MVSSHACSGVVGDGMQRVDRHELMVRAMKDHRDHRETPSWRQTVI